MKPKLDVVIIATVRADILRLTLASFTKKLLHQFDCRAIINVDPLGETDRNTPMDIVNICREYFAEVIYKVPHKPSFAKAVQWGWQQVNSELFFVLEDDWVLKHNVDGQTFIKQFNNANVVNVVLNKYGTEKTLQSANKAVGDIKKIDDFVIVSPPFLNPSFHRTAYIKELLNNFDVNDDPAFQFDKNEKHKTNSYQSPIALWHLQKNPMIIDIGRIWRRKYFIGKGDSINRPTWYAKTDNKIKSIPRQIRYEFYKQFWRLLYG